MNWTSAVVLAGWLVALLLPLSRAPSWGWTSPRVLGLLGSAAVLAALWVLVEIRSTNPLVDLRLMGRRPVWAANAAAFLVGVGMFAMVAFLPQLMQTDPAAGYGFGISVTLSGLIMASASTTQLLAALLVPRLDRRTGPRTVLACGTALNTLALLGMAVQHDSLLALVATQLGFGVGIGLAVAGLAGVVVTAVPAEQTGVASGMNANVRTIGGCVGTALTASVVTADLQPGGVPLESGYTAGFLVLAAAMAAATAAALLVPRTHSGPPSS